MYIFGQYHSQCNILASLGVLQHTTFVRVITKNGRVVGALQNCNKIDTYISIFSFSNTPSATLYLAWEYSHKHCTAFERILPKNGILLEGAIPNCQKTETGRDFSVSPLCQSYASE